MYKEHKLPNGETITMTDEGDHPSKPWQVMCIDANGEEVRWAKDFATRAEAEVEYVRFG